MGEPKNLGKMGLYDASAMACKKCICVGCERLCVYRLQPTHVR